LAGAWAAKVVPAKTIAELIALARRDGKLDAGTAPPGTESYLAAELFRVMTGLDMTIVTYKGTGPLTNDLLGGHIPVAFNTLAPALGNIEAGSLRAIAVASPVRSSLLPAVPTVSNPGYRVSGRGAVCPAAGTPPIVERLSKELRAIMASGAPATLLGASATRGICRLFRVKLRNSRCELPRAGKPHRSTQHSRIIRPLQIPPILPHWDTG
jgi:tripartite-type tricarboxylate transporter receptor subunit TctC